MENDRKETALAGAEKIPARYTFADFIGSADNIVQTIEQCKRISRTYYPVLLIGESGVGKKIIADAIYTEYGGGRNIPFVRVNCSAISKEMLDSELFGHEKGAFAGANDLKKGKLEQAAGGMLLLDAIGEMNLELQSKLLRVLEDREFERIGGSRTIPMQARIIASTNQDLKRLVADGQFRMDLYYRLSAFEITLPPLRAHKEDIPLLIEHFQQQDGLKLEFTKGAMEMLRKYDWPGNVRELRNVLARFNLLYPDMVIGVQQVYSVTAEMSQLICLPEYRDPTAPMPKSPQRRKRAPVAKPGSQQDADAAPVMTLREAEIQAIQRAVDAAGSIPKAAPLLGISRATIYNKVRKYEL